MADLPSGLIFQWPESMVQPLGDGQPVDTDAGYVAVHIAHHVAAHILDITMDLSISQWATLWAHYIEHAGQDFNAFDEVTQTTRTVRYAETPTWTPSTEVPGHLTVRVTFVEVGS